MSLPDSYDWYNFNDKAGLIYFAADKVQEITMPVYEPKNIQEIIHLRGLSITYISSRLSKQLETFFAGNRANFTDVPVEFSSYSEFEQKVLRAAMNIGYGEVSTYKLIAKEIGKPKASRAVGNALGKNKALIVVPCHRVIGSNESLRGFSQGLEWKKFMLGLERTGVNELKVKLGSR